jgi:hypothetical protein
MLIVPWAHMRTFLLPVTLMLLSLNATAQEPPTNGASSEVLQSCLLGTGPGTWAELKLTSDQLERMRRIREACLEECDVPGVTKQDNPISNADGKMVISEVYNVLTADQYRAWLAYCAEYSSGGGAPK